MLKCLLRSLPVTALLVIALSMAIALSYNAQGFCSKTPGFEKYLNKIYNRGHKVTMYFFA
jgi:hypothetical protein